MLKEDIVVGEKYRLVNNPGCQVVPDGWQKKDFYIVVTDKNDSGSLDYTSYVDGKPYDSCGGCIYAQHLEPFSDSILTKVKIAMMKDPYKTLVKAGLMDMNKNLTKEGKELLEYIVTQHHITQLYSKLNLIKK